MRFQLRKCSKCNHYTLKGKCPKCNEETISVHPAKFSPDDKYMRYRLAERYSQSFSYNVNQQATRAQTAQNLEFMKITFSN